jgi:hypothetical protein
MKNRETEPAILTLHAFRPSPPSSARLAIGGFLRFSEKNKPPADTLAGFFIGRHFIGMDT